MFISSKLSFSASIVPLLILQLNDGMEKNVGYTFMAISFLKYNYIHCSSVKDVLIKKSKKKTGMKRIKW